VDRGDHGGMEFGGKMGACSKDGVQDLNSLCILRQNWSILQSAHSRHSRGRGCGVVKLSSNSQIYGSSYVDKCVIPIFLDNFTSLFNHLHSISVILI